jgi:hypothetical protein
MNRVIAAQRQQLSEPPGLTCELRIDPDQQQLTLE